MNFEEYKALLTLVRDEDLLDFCRKFHLHGEPFIFKDRADAYYEFRKRIADNFGIVFHEVIITGSAKNGFSHLKGTDFDLESDIDVAIVSDELYNKIMTDIHHYQMNLRKSRVSVSQSEIDMYHNFLEHTAIGWIRPDLLPASFRIEEPKTRWFEFFGSISYGRSEVGNHKVTAGVFKSYWYLEQYTLSGIQSIRKRLEVRRI